MAKKEEPAGMSAMDMLAKFQKDFGANVGNLGGALVSAERIPTNLFTFDLATGGGVPVGRCSIFFGPESSGKTNLALLTIASSQRLWPEKKCVFFDIENSFDPTWAKILGVDTDKLIVVKPSYGEQMVDMVEGFMYSPDCGVVVVDSLAAVISTVEVSNSAEKQSYGGNSILIGKMVRKTTLAMLEREKAGGTPPTLIYINQTRNKIGVMFGNPEDMPGGNAPRFQASLWVRLYGKNIMDPKVSQVMPVRKEISFIIRKWKMPIVAQSGKMEMITVPHDGFKPGELDDWKTISEYLKNFDQFNKAEGKKGGWVILEEEYPTIQAFKDRIYGEKDFGTEVRTAIIQRVLQDATLLDPTVYGDEPKAD